MKLQTAEKTEYAFYRGDELVTIGTMEEIAEETGLALATVQFYASPIAAKRGYKSAVVNLDSEEELEQRISVMPDHDRIQELMKQTGWTKTGIGVAIGRSENFMSTLLGMKGGTKLVNLERMAELFSVDVVELIEEATE